LVLWEAENSEFLHCREQLLDRLQESLHENRIAEREREREPTFAWLTREASCCYLENVYTLHQNKTSVNFIPLTRFTLLESKL
jgi:hypothetical protein